MLHSRFDTLPVIQAEIRAPALPKNRPAHFNSDRVPSAALRSNGRPGEQTSSQVCKTRLPIKSMCSTAISCQLVRHEYLRTMPGGSKRDWAPPKLNQPAEKALPEVRGQLAWRLTANRVVARKVADV